jgi:uncharacterized membrane protein YecN with MAPEG domain
MTARWRGILALVLLAVSGVAAALPPASDAAPVSDEVLRDPDFGVTARHFGLERRVAMYQWRASGPGYERVWSEQPIDSTGYAPGHDNPEFPLHGRRWVARRITLDGKPLDASAIARFGQWNVFRPNFSRLPGNLAATFQPEGDGLGSAENPLDPQIGDLRIGWRELTLPPLEGRVALDEGVWVPAPDAPEERAQTASSRPQVPARVPAIALLFAGLHGLLLLALSAQVSRWRYRARAGLGDGGNADLARRIRVQGNFVEYVPLALVLLVLLELGGLAPAWLWVAGAALLAGRLLHAWGLSRSEGPSFGRYWGTALTWGALLARALAAVWLAVGPWGRGLLG